MGVVQRIGMVATDKNDKPKSPISIHMAKAYRGIPPDDDISQGQNLLAIAQN
jgi:hypothetical protein